MATEVNLDPSENPQVEGFFTWSCSDDKARLRRLKTSVLAMFEHRKGQPKHGRRRMSDVIELGVLFSSAEKEVFNVHAVSLVFISLHPKVTPFFFQNKFDFAEATELPEHHEVLAFIAEQLVKHRDFVAQNSASHPEPNNDHNINIVIRRYRPGQSIGFHTDRVEKLDDMVWSVVVDCGEPTDGLHFELSDGTRVPVLEHPGLVSVQTGKSRAVFKHGVSSVKRERISITWRFFLPEFLNQLTPDPAVTCQDRMQWMLGAMQDVRRTLSPPPLPPPLAAPKTSSPDSPNSDPANAKLKVGIIASPAGRDDSPQNPLANIGHQFCLAVGMALGERFGSEVSLLTCATQNNDQTRCVRDGLRRVSPCAPIRMVQPELDSNEAKDVTGYDADGMYFSNIADVYILIEGGFDSATLAREVEQADKPLLRVGCTGGAAAAWFGALETKKPPCVSEMDWDRLQHTDVFQPAESAPEKIHNVAYSVGLAVSSAFEQGHQYPRDFAQPAGHYAIPHELEAFPPPPLLDAGFLGHYQRSPLMI